MLNGQEQAVTMDLLVTLPHVVAVLIVVGWFLSARRERRAEPDGTGDGDGGNRTPPPDPRLPLVGGGRHDDLARSA
jgi:hypothetical protein